METTKSKKSFKERLISSQTLLCMLLVQGFGTGMQLLSRVILVGGTFPFALITYRHIVAAICVAPLAFYFERMTLSQGLFYYGLRDTSASYAVNFLNLVPICTFFVSIICRMENLGLQTWTGRAKCIGAILCVGGALTTTLYKGIEFYLGRHHHHIGDAIVAHKSNMLRGTFFLIGSCFSYTAWFIVQVKLLKVFPLKYWGTMLACILAAIQGAIIGVCIDSSKAPWKLNEKMELVTIVYSGALATAATFCLLSWTITIKGPTYPSVFNPLVLIFVTFSEAILLGEPLSVGTMLGVVLIMVGLYSFLWGKKNEAPRMAQPQPSVVTLEVSSMGDLPKGPQTTATVAPTFSPIVLEIENT